MKKLIPLSLFVLALTTTTPAFAQGYPVNPTTAPTVSVAPTLTARQKFMTKLGQIKDAKKQAIVTRIDQLIIQINNSRTAIMLRHLDTIQSVLTKLQAKLPDLQNGGKDITAVSAAITKAQKAIDTARAAVIAQQTKTYAINITTDANLGAAVSATRTQFAKDLQAAHQTVVAARKAVRAVITAMAKIAGEKLESTTND